MSEDDLELYLDYLLEEDGIETEDRPDLIKRIKEMINCQSTNRKEMLQDTQPVQSAENYSMLLLPIGYSDGQFDSNTSIYAQSITASGLA